MRDYLFLIVAAASIALLSGCSDEDVLKEGTGDGPFNGSRRYSVENVKTMSRNFFDDGTRVGELEDPVVIPLVECRKSTATRSSVGLGDTVAYIVNYYDSQKFTIVSAEECLSPILAYSDSNALDPENPMVKENFVNLISRSSIVPIDPGTPQPLKPLETETAGPYLTTVLHGDAPFNAYVNVLHPGWPAGCVPVAAAYVMSHCKKTLVYNDYTYDFESINAGLQTATNTSSYKSASKDMARLMYYFGIDINAQYLNEVDDNHNYVGRCTSADIWDACTQMKKMGFSVPINKTNVGEKDLPQYNVDAVTTYLKDGYLVLQDGHKPGNAKMGDMPG